jgi:orotate phosphoribosyltransferase
MVEDTMTTGLSTLKAIDVVRAHGAEVLGVITLVNRSEDAAALYNAQGLPLISLYTGTELLEAAQSS